MPSASLLQSVRRLAACTALAVACDHKSDQPLTVGDLAPDLQGEDTQGQPVRLSDLQNNPSVIYFYPKDDTPGCTKEACAFRDQFNKYAQKGISVFGVSRDSIESHRIFRKKHNLPFLLVADESGSIARSYKVLGKAGMARRVTFLVGPDKIIRRVWLNVDPAAHATEILESL